MIENGRKSSINGELTPASRYFGSLNVTEEILKSSFEGISVLSDDQLLLLDEHLRNIRRHAWKLRCALFAEVKRRVGRRGGKTKELKAVAAEFGISLSTLYRKAQIWETFFQDPSSESIKHRDVSYLFEELDNAEDWFIRALAAEDPIAAIRKAEQRYQELNGEYTPRQFAAEIMLERLKVELKWIPVTVVVPADKVDIVQRGLDNLVEGYAIDEPAKQKGWGLALVELFERSLPKE